MGLTDIIKQGRRLGMALLMAGSLSCVHEPVFQAKRDYQVYPKYRKDIAFYNIQNILKENCKKPADYDPPLVNEEGFTCEYASCTTDINKPLGAMRMYTTDFDFCFDKQVESHSFRWDEIEIVGIGAGGACLEINNRGCATVPVGSRRQGQLHDLVEAITIYLQETRTARTPSDKPGYIK